jgi:hypothetical protein
MSGSIPPIPNTPSWRGAQLKHRDNFTFTYPGSCFLPLRSIHSPQHPVLKHHQSVLCNPTYTVPKLKPSSNTTCKSSLRV